MNVSKRLRLWFDKKMNSNIQVSSSCSVELPAHCPKHNLRNLSKGFKTKQDQTSATPFHIDIALRVPLSISGFKEEANTGRLQHLQ